MSPDRYNMDGSAGLAGSYRWSEIFRRSHYLIGHSILLAADYTDTAPFAFLRIDVSLIFFGIRAFPHLDGFERAPFDTHLAAFALIFIDHGQEPVRLHQVEPVSAGYGEEVFTGAGTTKTVSPVDKPGFFGSAGGIERFSQR